MIQKVPHSPFTTRLSGSAKEMELRIRNIFQWKKKRPPIIALVAAVLVIALCGSLIGFTTINTEEPAPDDPVAESTPSTDDPVQETPPALSDTNDPSAVLAAMAAVKAEDFTNPEYFGIVSAEALVAALNAAVDNQISEAEFMDALGGSYGQVFPHWYIEDAWLEGDSGGHPGTDRNLDIRCGLPENIVEVTLSEDNHRDTAYFEDATLYWLVREKDAAEEHMTAIDPAAYEQFKGLLIDRMEHTLSQFEGNPGNFTGYDLIRFTRAWNYEDERDGSQVELYYFSFGLLTDHPEKVGWAGGMALDHKLRVVGVGPGQLAVKYRNGQVVCTTFMGNDFYYSPDDISQADWAKEHINSALNWAEHATSVAQSLPVDARQSVLDYLWQEYADPVYYLGEEPSLPQEGNWRIDSISYQGETRLYETVGRVYDLSLSTYYSSRWNEVSPICLVLSFSIDGTLNGIEGISHVTTESMPADYIIKQVVNNLMDLEVSLMRDGYPWPAGPGNQVQFHREVYDGPETIEILENWEPIYWDGDYWAMHSWNGFKALCYHHADTGTYNINRIDTTRTDLFTHRGIRVGDSREDVIAAYPELKSGDYWGQYPGEDILWYCNDPNDFGAALIFFFESDTVSRIVLNNMFN